MWYMVGISPRGALSVNGGFSAAGSGSVEETAGGETADGLAAVNRMEETARAVVVRTRLRAAVRRLFGREAARFTAELCAIEIAEEAAEVLVWRRSR